MKISSLSAVLILFFAANCAFGQINPHTSGIQDSLSKLSSIIWKQKTDSSRLKANSIFFSKLQSTLESRSSVGLVLDSINGISCVASGDGKIRIFTWNVPISDGTNKYFGFIQLQSDSSVVISLQSTVNDFADFETKMLSPQMWYGAIYYKLIEVEISGQKAYTLLGWDGYTSNSNRKFIDIVYVDNNKNPVFGMPVFKTEKGIKTRIVFEYAERATMLLRYDFQAIMVNKGKKIKKENAWLIVMDRLVPMDPSMEGFRKFYVPAGDTYDGFIFSSGFWSLVENIDVANNPNRTK